jgi:DNA polymerase III alpha subunit
MKISNYGEVILDSIDVFQGLYSDKISDINPIFLEDTPECRTFIESCKKNFDKFNNVKIYQDPNISVEQFDTNLQNDWFCTEKYKLFDIGQWLLDQCKTEEETTRVLEELELYVQHDMIEVLNYLKYLVDTMREHKIVWGVGRGSSVASYCLYLLGAHKVNSIKYKLNINEFLK